ncbi:PREDICTED: mitochondrial outer membrane import complex protein METAXIN [Tarenaya hassleriana]|uniref:mitochondrial outer membrane import complex protein METAXIN n=1 Tax=Tarenaya hassleriana TaxID=28532 RepID=UPI00053C7202|nr:PREDICTED: mitochondrial outer membrane import complex protein METAXIN [Tarenaya hassleriana]
MEGEQETVDFTLVARKPYFGLPTACPSCLPVYVYLKLAQVPFQLAFNSTFPDSDQIPYFEAGSTHVAYNNENGGVIENLKRDGIVNLDSRFQSLPEFISLKSLIVSWLGEALTYELWIGTEGSSAWEIYYSDLPWVISKVLFLKQMYMAKTQLGISKDNAEERAKQIYKRASEAYTALSTRLGEQKFLFEDRPSSLDAFFLAHVLFTLQALPETSVLRSKLMEHNNLVRYAEKLKSDFLEASSSSSPSPLHSFASSFSRKSSKPKSKPKGEKTEEEKKFKKRARFFLAAQFIAIVLYLSVMGGVSSDELEYEDDD